MKLSSWFEAGFWTCLLFVNSVILPAHCKNYINTGDQVSLFFIPFTGLLIVFCLLNLILSIKR